MKTEQMKEYYLGLDIGTDSVGYAATTTEYNLVKYHGEPAWGVMTFEAANPAQERRAFRVARRRLDRRQQRVKLLEEIFVPEICRIDPRFFIRRRESFLCREDAQEPFCLFSDDRYTDREYSRQYPTIHHLIVELMNSDKPHDVRLVFHACAWLVAHRGHFLFDIPADRAAELLDFNSVYGQFCEYFAAEGHDLPWRADMTADELLSVLRLKGGVRVKEKAFQQAAAQGKKIEDVDGEPYSRKAIVELLCGRKVKPVDLFKNDEYADIESVALSMDDEQFASVLANLGDDGELLRKLRSLTDCAMLISTSSGKLISEAKVDVYEQHKKDLAWLKYFVKKYMKPQYNQIFRSAEAGNYVAYSGNVKSCPEPDKVKRAKKDAFSEYLRKKVKKIEVAEKDEKQYQDMLERLDNCTFLPKQRDSDNRVIPQQLYRIELEKLLDRASAYLPMLEQKDQSGFTAREKILSVFDFKIPYYVGPLGRVGENVWAVRKDGKIYPWNFADMVDLDQSEERFIRRMTNTCTYLPGEDVLPMSSLLYSRFMVLNEINPIKINGRPISVEAKQGLFNDLFMTRKRVTRKQIEDWFRSKGVLGKGDELTGIDITVKSNLSAYLDFERFLSSGALSEADVEAIIFRAAYSEDRMRLQRWLAKNYPALSKAEREYISKLKLKEFGRLSAKFLTGIYDDKKDGTGEARNLIDAMWETNENLMQLLSDRYQYRAAVEQMAREYYDAHPKSLSERLSEMYVSAAVRRPILRALDVTDDVVKALGAPPKKIFVEMARGGTPNQKGKRTKTRKQQLQELYRKIDTEDVRLLEKELDAMGEMADNRLQSDALFLYYLQLGKSAYSGKPIELSRLASGDYNVDHIYPQSLVKDDSILNNKVLALSTENGEKSDALVPREWQMKMRGFWSYLREQGLMTDEKFRRLTRTAPFSDDEKQSFINRQLVETRQSTKVVAELLKERYPDSEIVYVKAGIVSEFRQEFDIVKCRALNDLHHAKDAYLNVVVGNVYHERFSKQWFSLDQKYNIQVKKIFAAPVVCGKESVWSGQEDLSRVKKIAAKNAVHLTRYAFCRKGRLFEQTRCKAAPDLVPLKKGLPTESYGGYNSAAATFFLLVRYRTGKKTDVGFVPVELLDVEKVCSSAEYAEEYAKKMLCRITGKEVESAELLLNGRALKINTVFSLDGLRMVLCGKSSGGRQLGMALQTPLLLSAEEAKYIKALDSFLEKRKTNQKIVLDERHDGICGERDLALYQTLTSKLEQTPFVHMPANQATVLKKGAPLFKKLSLEQQAQVLMNITGLFSSASANYDLSAVSGSKQAGAKLLSFSLTNWKKSYHEVRIVDASPSGLHETVSENLLELL